MTLLKFEKPQERVAKKTFLLLDLRYAEKQKHVESNDTQAKVQIMGTTEQANIKKNSPKNEMDQCIQILRSMNGCCFMQNSRPKRLMPGFEEEIRWGGEGCQ